MGSRFEKFSQHARLVLSLAQEESHRFNQNYIGTEHILLGLVRETEGVAARVLSSLLVDLTKVRSGVESIIVRGDQPAQGDYSQEANERDASHSPPTIYLEPLCYYRQSTNLNHALVGGPGNAKCYIESD